MKTKLSFPTTQLLLCKCAGGLRKSHDSLSRLIKILNTTSTIRRCLVNKITHDYDWDSSHAIKNFFFCSTRQICDYSVNNKQPGKWESVGKQGKREKTRKNLCTCFFLQETIKKADKFLDNTQKPCRIGKLMQPIKTQQTNTDNCLRRNVLFQGQYLTVPSPLETTRGGTNHLPSEASWDGKNALWFVYLS